MFFPALIDNTGLSIAIINYHTDLIKDSFVCAFVKKKRFRICEFVSPIFKRR